MTLKVPTSRIPQRGVPTLAVFAAFFAVLTLVASLGLAGRAVEKPPKPTVPAAVVVAPTAKPAASTVAAASYAPCPAARLPSVADPFPRHPADLAPTGLEAVAAPAPGPSLLVGDRDGSLWEIRAGYLLHVLRAGRHDSWTVADDPSFGASSLLPALGGGVWLPSPSGVRWFDGASFRDVVPAPEDDMLFGVAEAPDGSLWAITSAPSLLRWDGRTWSRVDDCGPIPASFQMRAVAVDSDGGVWVARFDASAADGSGETVLAHLDRGTWSHYGAADSPALSGAVITMEPAADGSMWVGTTVGVARIPWSGKPITYLDRLADTVAISPRPDGSAVVATAGSTAERYTYGLRAISPGSATSQAIATAFPGPPQAPGWLSVRETSEGLFVSSWDGLFEIDGDQRVPIATYAGPRSPARLVAVSGTSAWIGYASGTGYFSEDGWAADPPDGLLIPARGLARDLRGRIWAATDVGTIVFVGRRWIGPAGKPAVGVAVGPDGSAWAVTQAGAVEHVRLVGERLVAEPVARPPLPGANGVAVEANGTVWVASPSDGLAAFDGRTWTIARPLDWPRTAGATDVTVAPNGDVWAALVAQPGAGTTILARLHGRAWTVWDETEQVPAKVTSICAGPGGVVWAAGDGLARFDGRHWTSRLSGLEMGPLSVAPDGTVMVVGPGGVFRVASSP